MRKYKEILDRWLNGEIHQFSNGISDVQKQGWADIHYGQLVGKKEIAVEDVYEAVSIFGELIDRVEEMGEDWVVKIYIPLKRRRKLIKDIKELAKDLPDVSGLSFYLAKPEILACPFPAELHRWPIKPGSYGKFCPKAKWFLEQSRSMEEIESGEKYNTDDVGWWRGQAK